MQIMLNNVIPCQQNKHGISTPTYVTRASFSDIVPACVQAAGSKQAFILPAFETYGSYKEAAALADTIAFKDKARLMTAALDAGRHASCMAVDCTWLLGIPSDGYHCRYCISILVSNCYSVMNPPLQRFLLNAVGRGLAGYFDQQRFPSGHNATQFQTWYSTGADYLIAYRER
jgi:hypothetical protein